jgi:AhpC/TSA family
MAISDRKLRLAGAVAVAVAAIVVPVLVLLRGAKRQAAAGAPVPELSGKAVRGGEVDLTRLAGHIVLLSFLNSRAQTSRKGDASLSQSTFLRSMETQHARFGLRTIVIDATEVAGAGRLGRTDVLNWTYNWNIAPPIAVLPDEDGRIARRFGVTKTPTTFLIDGNGTINKRWDGFVMVANLDFAIRTLEGRRPGSQ